MMSFKQWSCLLCLDIAYLFVGASIFYHIENPLELEKKLVERRERIEINKLLHKNYFPSDAEALHDLLSKLSDFCGKPVDNVTDTETPFLVWDFYHSFFFSYTVVSTVGYGNLAPSTSLGRIVMIFYAIIGIPVNAILFANLGEFFGDTFRGLYKKYKFKHPASGDNIDYQILRFGLVGQIAMYLIPGFLFFIFLPACLFVIFEGWDYTLAVYYAFVTLTTIGFGDYVAGMTDNNSTFGIYFTMYKIFLIFWITFGLGYLVMVVGFLTQGLRSKKMLELEHKLAQNLKETQSKIWNGVTKDVSYLRKILNEVYMMRFKPVYNDETPPLRIHRSSSCPSLSFAKETPRVARRRAMSEARPFDPAELMRVQSDTDLLSIDRNRTFATGSVVQPAELLARVVDALGSIKDNEDSFAEDGFHGFSDEEILASEMAESGWNLGGERMFAQPPAVPRARAVSEIKVPVCPEDKYVNGDWTWSSPAASEKIKELMKQRRNGKLSEPNVSAICRPSISIGGVTSSPPRTLINKLNPFKKPPKLVDAEKDRIMPQVTDSMTPAEYLRKTARGRASMAPLSSQQRYANARGSRVSRISLPTDSADVLENTTIADLIRALEALHAGSPAAPRRKLGTASLTPPKQPSPLMKLFPPEVPRPRRFSVHPAILTPTGRRQSMAAAALPPTLARRRFSVLQPASNASFSPTLTPLVAGSVAMQRRGSQSRPPPYSALEVPGLSRRRPPPGGRRQSMWGSATPSPRPRRPRYPPSITETSPTGRTRHESLTDIRIDDLERSHSTDS